MIFYDMSLMLFSSVCSSGVIADDVQARLLCRLSPRPLRLSEIEGAGNAADFVQRLARHDLIAAFGGNPGLVKALAPRLQNLQLHEVQVQLPASAEKLAGA